MGGELVSDLSISAMSNFAEMIHQPTELRPWGSVLSDRTRVTLDVPFEQLSVFARSYESSSALVAMPVYAIAVLAEATDGELDGTEPLVEVPLGLLGTDHVGYASFDLGVLQARQTLDALHAAGVVQEGSSVTVVLRHLWVFPWGDSLLQTDALVEGDLGPRVIVLRLELDASQVADRVFEHPLASMQNASILDWRLSPGSFTLAGALLVGEHGCESLLPSNLSTQRFRFTQVARLPDALYERKYEERIETRDGPHHEIDVVVRSERYRLGRIFEYATEWFPVGHSLGPLAYSLPLAPGEIVNVAVIDWSRSDAGTRDEQTSLSESLVHDQFRDRSITESVHAVLEEWQRGGSVMGGVAGSGGFGGGGMGIGGAASLGGAYTTSAGSRDLAVDTAQRVADSFHQATSAMRELRSTVVVQTNQQEKASAQTRVVANYNHSHALTILYYEVLRHYRVVTRLAGSRPALLVDFRFSRFDFAEETVLIARRRELELLLLDDRLKASFDALSRVRVGRESFEAAKKLPKPPPPAETVIDQLRITLATGDDGTDGEPWVDLILTDGQRVQTHQMEPNDHANPRFLGKPGYGDFESGDVDTYGLKPTALIRWGRLRGFILGLKGGGDWKVDHIHLEGVTPSGEVITLYAAGYGKTLPNDTQTVELLTAKPPPPPGAPTIESFVSAADLQALDVLVRHLKAHQHYYNRALWLNEDTNARAARFESLSIDGMPLLDIIENRAVEVSGDWVAFPLASRMVDKVLRSFEARGDDPPDPADGFIEQLLSLPSRGVFAEAKLGHCNASEVIDPTRFWDWQTSPIPHQPPAIAPVDTGSRAKDMTGLTPTDLPASLVNIVSPSPAPDPAGMAGALTSIATPGIFRDMSAVKELGSLLEKLSDNATSMASQGMKSSDRKDLLTDIRDSDELSDEKKAKLVEDLLQREVTGPGGSKAGSSTGDGSDGSGGGATPGTTSGGDHGGTVGGTSTDITPQATVKSTGPTQTVAPTQKGGTKQTGTGQQRQPIKQPRTEQLPPGKVRVIAVFSGFQEIGSIRTAWGTLAGDDGAADGIPNGPPFAGMKNYLCNHITGPGSMQLFVQLADAASTTLDDAVRFKPDANNTVHVQVQPKLFEVEVEETTEYKAKLKAELSFKNSHGAEVPIRVIMVKVEEVFGIGVSGEVGGSTSTRKRFKYVVIRKGLDMKVTPPVP